MSRPRLGFLGLGWIGLNRLEAVLESELATVVAISDRAPGAVEAALEQAPGAAVAGNLDELLSHGLDGLVIATPSALHAPQAIRALDAGVAVFCQKPLARHADEAAAVIRSARQADRLLGLDLCYRRTRAMEAARRLVAGGELGRVYALRLTFHNAYGPDKAWFYERSLSGGGCAIDLGIHLVDLALWLTGFPAVQTVEARMLAQGRPVREGLVEDYCVARLDLEGDRVAELACSWNLQAGADCVIEVLAWGEAGGVEVRNRSGSFFDFEARRLHKTWSEPLVEPPDEWGGRTITDWVRRLGEAPGFDPQAEEFLAVATVLDRIYERAAGAEPCAS